jgi:hypothetical protein
MERQPSRKGKSPQRKPIAKELELYAAQELGVEPVVNPVEVLTSGQSTAQEKLANYEKVLSLMPKDPRITGPAEIRGLRERVEEAAALIEDPNLPVNVLQDALAIAKLNRAPKTHIDWIEIQLDSAKKMAARDKDVKSEKTPSKPKKVEEIGFKDVLKAMFLYASVMTGFFAVEDAYKKYISPSAPAAASPTNNTSRPPVVMSVPRVPPESVRSPHTIAAPQQPRIVNSQQYNQEAYVSVIADSEARRQRLYRAAESAKNPNFNSYVPSVQRSNPNEIGGSPQPSDTSVEEQATQSKTSDSDATVEQIVVRENQIVPPPPIPPRPPAVPTNPQMRQPIQPPVAPLPPVVLPPVPPQPPVSPIRR